MEILQLIINYLNRLTKYYRDKVFLLKYVFCNQEIVSDYLINPTNFQIESCAIWDVIIPL